ncbi:CidA/LrgA family protein [Acidiphilium sp. AL]|uniref:CidA/LrgA family protein n=1 Tax=Acidiphilium iwatense TaxID=768198 RepID=A0ABS9DYP9_9PROT|nr:MULTISPECIES: CidA/LrgA family protein [Acidiphilium]MCF3946811.1 CidA/LrgA family protein [Acidiphilium iwatense]MCU4160840.1 CidA/LrgA family protein [Acidiphilium sp. AL]
MIGALSLLLVCQLIGTIVAHAAGWPIPGPVLGLVLLLGLLIRRGGPPPPVHDTAQGLLKQLGLLFVPAGVGIVNELHVLRTDALAIAVAIPVSTLLALGVTGTVMQLLARGDR